MSDVTRDGSGTARSRTWRLVTLLVFAFVCSAALAAILATAELGPTVAVEWLRAQADRAHVYGPRTSHLREARRLQKANAAADAKRAVEQGDTRLLAVAGVATGIPGTPESRFAELSGTHSLRLLYGGCVVASEEERTFRDAAYEYAGKYNVAVLNMESAQLSNSVLQPTGAPEHAR